MLASHLVVRTTPALDAAQWPQAGINEEQVEDVLLALAPLVGSARVVSAGSKIARALGIAVLGAEADVEANDDES